jgi:hypothetical protein
MFKIDNMKYTFPISLFLLFAISCSSPEKDRTVEILGIYGGSPIQPDSDQKLEDFGVNAVFVGSGRLTPELIAKVKNDGGRIFAEFNTMHVARYLEDHPDAAPVGVDGEVSPPQEGWQGICPTHGDYRQNRMDNFRETLTRFDIDGIWLDYHHAHASWERAEPLMPDTCFCDRCVSLFSEQTGIKIPDEPKPEISKLLLTELRSEWIRWRCDVFTDWVKEFKSIIESTRPDTLLGTYHNPWSDEDFGGARIEKLAIDLKAQAQYIDVFSPMPYHARFGHSNDVDWISRQVTWLGKYLGIRGVPGDKIRIWPIVQLSDWGETVPASQVESIIREGIKPPATGVMVFAWGSLRKQPEKVEELRRVYLQIRQKF